MADLPITPAWVAGIYQIERTDPVVGANPLDVNDVGVANLQAQQLGARTLYLKDRIEAMTVAAGLTVTVGATGDYLTINAALTALSQAFPTHVPAGLNIVIELQAGFVMAEQVIVQGVNLGWITLSGVDAQTQIQRSALTTVVNGSRYPAFAALGGGFLPVINQLFEMDTSGTATARDGVYVSGGGAGVRVRAGKGVKRAGATGLRVDGGAGAWAGQSDFRQATENGCFVSTGGVANVESSNFQTAGNIGIYGLAGARINADSAVVTGCTAGGVRSTSGATVNINNANAQMGGAPASSDISVLSGGGIAAAGATGGTNITVNTMTASGYIMR